MSDSSTPTTPIRKLDTIPVVEMIVENIMLKRKHDNAVAAASQNRSVWYENGCLLLQTENAGVKRVKCVEPEEDKGTLVANYLSTMHPDIVKPLISPYLYLFKTQDDAATADDDDDENKENIPPSIGAAAKKTPE